MGVVRAFKRLLGLVCVAVAALLGLFALVGYFPDNTSGSRTLAVPPSSGPWPSCF